MANIIRTGGSGSFKNVIGDKAENNSNSTTTITQSINVNSNVYAVMVSLGYDGGTSQSKLNIYATTGGEEIELTEANGTLNEQIPTRSYGGSTRTKVWLNNGELKGKAFESVRVEGYSHAPKVTIQAII